MSYTPTTWATGDTITASAMNKIENGIANAGGSAYDAVFKGNAYVSNTTVTKVSGNYSAVVAKLQNLEPVNILYYEEPVSGYGVGLGQVTQAAYNETDIAMTVVGDGVVHTGYLIWESDDSVAWD